MIPRMGPMLMGGPAKHLEGRIAFLRTELGIIDTQMPLFNAFTEALWVAAKSVQGLHNQMISGKCPDTLPERLAWYEQIMTAHLEAFKKVRSTAVSLYQALSAEQQQLADSFMIGMI